MDEFKSLNGYLVKDEQARNNIAVIKSDVSSLQKDTSSLKDTTATNSNAISTIQNNMTTINQNVADVNENLASTNGYLNSVVANVNAMQSTFESVTGDISNLNNDNATNKNKINTLETDNTTNKANILNLQTDVSELKGVVLYNVEGGTHVGGELSEEYTNFDEIKIIYGPSSQDHGRCETMPTLFNAICLQHTSGNNTSVYLCTSTITFSGTSFTFSKNKEIQLDGSSHAAANDNSLTIYKIVGIKY